jgi:hypothetical protein
MTSSGLMQNPPHPGEFIRDVYLDALQLSVRGARRWAKRSGWSWGCCPCGAGLGKLAPPIGLAGDGGGFVSAGLGLWLALP